MLKLLLGLVLVLSQGAVMSSCQGIGKFLGPVVQPVIGQTLSTFANAFTNSILHGS